MATDIAPVPRPDAVLRQHIADLVAELAELAAELRNINDPDMHRRVQALARIGPELARAHGAAPGPDIADALTGLLAAARALDVPMRDPDLGPTPTLRQVRSAKGLIVAAADDALKAAAVLGWHPAQEPFTREFAVAVARAQHRAELEKLEERLNLVESQLGDLDPARIPPTNFVQQNGLLNLYVPAMRVEIDLVRMHLIVGEETVDLSVLMRAALAMGRMTRNFVATVKAWATRVSDAVTRGAEAVRDSVRALVTGVRGLARSLLRDDGPTPGTIHRDGPDYPELVLIPAGTFTMGVPEEEGAREKTDDDDARPLHDVTIAKPFWMGRYPVTRGEYAAFVADTGYDKDDGEWRVPGFEQTERDPVVNVRPEDADEYVAWLSRKTGQTYRLPSEAEWEYAARAGTQTARFWGDAFEPGAKDYVHRGRATAPVDGRSPNPFGLHDVLGNIWEWCADPWHPNYVGAPTDGSIWASNDKTASRVARGGSWFSYPRNIRAGYRSNFDIRSRLRASVGFRVVRT